MSFLPKTVGTFHGIRIYETVHLGDGYNSAGLALPGIGIFVGTGVYSLKKDMETVMHEYGHILQSKLTGTFKFYILVGLPSLLSAWFNWHRKGHHLYWTEVWCNHLVKEHFRNLSWDDERFPAKDISKKTKYWLI